MTNITDGTTVGSDPEPRTAAQEYIDNMARARGYVLTYHSVMAQSDFPVLYAANALVSSCYLDQRQLDRRTKELIFIVSLTVMRAEPHHIKSHIRVALELGVSPSEILEAIEIALPEAGVVAFQHGLGAWQEVVGVEGLHPTPDVSAP
jgi:4-carboxymuconolactone decarboxylase